MKKSVRSSAQPPFLVSRINDLRHSYTHPPLDYENELLEAIRLAQEEKALSILDKINALEAATLAVYPLRSKKNALIASCTLFTRASIRGGVDPETAFQMSDALILEIERKGTVEQLASFEQEMLLEFIIASRRAKEPIRYSHLVNLSISYIHEHVLQTITLPAIAQYCKVNPCYLSDRFKRETGLPLTTYINQLKIEESKALLTYTNQSITEIALMLKFGSQSYYTKLFKAFTGLTPRQYRNKGVPS